MCSTLDPLQCDFRSLGGDDFEDAVLVVLVVVELCVRSSQGLIILPSSPREFNSRPELFLYLFLNRSIMSNVILSIAGTIHQGHERFSDISSGRQRPFMSFSALLCAQSCLVRHWDTATVDKTLVEGDRMYLNALESQNIPDTETLLHPINSSI